MSVITVIKKIGEKIISIVEWPIVHSVLLAKYFLSAQKDFPATRTAFLGLVQKIEAIGPDAIAAIAANGFNVPDDVKLGADIAALFKFVKDDLLPVIEADYADFEKDKGAAGPAPSLPAADAPGLHNVVPA